MALFEPMGKPSPSLYREVIENKKRRVDNSQSSFGSLSQVDENVRDLLLHPNDIGNCRENSLTEKGKRIQLIKMLVLILIPIISLAVLAMLDLKTTAHNNNSNVEVRNVIRFSREIGMLLSRLQRERDMAALYVSVIGSEDNVYLTETYPLTDVALDELQDWPVETQSLNEVVFFEKKSDFKEHLASHRRNLKRNDTTVYREIDFYTSSLQIFIDWLYESVGRSKGHAIWQPLVAYQLLIVSNVDTGIERTLGSVFFVRGRFDRHEDYVWYLDKYNVGTWNFHASKHYSDLITVLYDREAARNSDNFMDNISRMRTVIFEFGNVMYSGFKDPNFNDATLWFESMTVYIEILENVQKNMADEILARLEVDLQSDTKSIAVSISLEIIVIIMCPLILRAFWSLTTDIQNSAITLATQTKDFQKEKNRTNYLLYSKMPRCIAMQLMSNTNTGKADSNAIVTVLSSEIYRFEQLCSDSTPMQVVEMLNGLFLVFDCRIKQYNVYKVETKNKTYMLASGYGFADLPSHEGWCHTVEMANVALDLLYDISCLEVHHKKDKTITMKVGIDTGPVVAAVVGNKMPRYCLFGDTVATASRMQTTGISMRVQLSEASYLILLEKGGFELMQKEAVKRKNQKNTYWLKRKDMFKPLIRPNDMVTNQLLTTDGRDTHTYEHLFNSTYTSCIQQRDRPFSSDFDYSNGL